ncbi:MAG: hypothetical protein ACM3NQ_20630 [Bacteroidales bacterium]
MNSRTSSRRVFLLSPASSNGARAQMLLSPRARFALAEQLRSPSGATLGEVFSFLSGLYFRGKLAYGSAFGQPLVITPLLGLQPPDYPVTEALLRQFARVDIDAGNPAYRKPLEASAALVDEFAGPHATVVLLGSIATGKYVDVLLERFGERLLFPQEFVGRGDMSRGGLLLRAVRAGLELTYVPVKGAVRHGARPPKLPPIPRRG